MKFIKDFLKSLLQSADPFAAEKRYYEDAVDLYDLEMRMRNVQRGEAPFQTRIRAQYY